MFFYSQIAIVQGRRGTLEKASPISYGSGAVFLQDQTSIRQISIQVIMTYYIEEDEHSRIIL